MKKILLGILCLILLAGMTSASGWAAELKKTQQKSFPASKETVLEIDNRFGMIRIENWPVQEISIQVEIKSEAGSEKRAAEILSNISVEIGKAGNTVSGMTRLGNMNNKNGESFSVDYTIRVPNHLRMNISNEFGDSYINAPCAASEFSSRFGTLFMQSQTMPVEITVEHGSARLQSFAELTLELRHSNLNADRIDRARLDMQHSTATLGDGGEWKVTAQHSNIKAGSIDRLELDDEFSPFQVERIVRRLHVSDLQHASVKVEAFDPAFEEIYVDAQHSNVTLFIPSESAFLIDASANFGGLKIENRKVQVSYPYDSSNRPDQFTEVVKGYVQRENATAKVFFRGQHSDFIIR